jgi:hypothetical protein
LGFSASSQPVINTAPSSLLLGEALALIGTRFRGIGEGSGGNASQHSAGDVPMVQLQAVEGGQTAILKLGLNWSATAFTSTAITGFPLGQTLVTVFSNGIPSASKIIKLTVPDPPPYDVWKATHFTSTDLANPAISGDLADPDLDGTVNLLEYLQALNPKVADTALLPVAGQQDGFATFTYRFNKLATDVTYRVESSPDLTDGSWSATTVNLSQVDHGSYLMITVVQSESIAATSSRFMRLRVERP